MNTAEFVAKQLALSEPDRVIPDRMYMWGNRTDNLQMLRKREPPYSAADVFKAAVYYENAKYFGPNGAGRRRYYPNRVF